MATSKKRQLIVPPLMETNGRAFRRLHESDHVGSFGCFFNSHGRDNFYGHAQSSDGETGIAEHTSALDSDSAHHRWHHAELSHNGDGIRHW